MHTESNWSLTPQTCLLLPASCLAAGPKGKAKVQQSIFGFMKKAAAGQETAAAGPSAEAVHKENQPSGGSNASGDEPEVVIVE